MKYKIVWIESHNPTNWGRNWKEGRTNILNRLPNPKIIDIGNNDEWLDLECAGYFEAKNIEEAKKIAREHQHQRDSGVFAVFDNKGKMAFTEQEIESEG